MTDTYVIGGVGLANGAMALARMRTNYRFYDGVAERKAIRGLRDVFPFSHEYYRILDSCAASWRELPRDGRTVRL